MAAAPILTAPVANAGSIWAKKPVDAAGKWNCPQCFCENTTKTCPACNFVKADFAGLISFQGSWTTVHEGTKSWSES